VTQPHTQDTFVLTELNLTHYRGFSELSLPLHPGVNVLIGPSGAGKTAVLGGAAIVLGAWFLGIPKIDSRWILDEEMQRIATPKGMARCGVTEVKGTGNIQGVEGVVWSRTRGDGKTTTKEAKPLRELAKAIDHKVAGMQNVTLPMIGYYGVGRSWGDRYMGVVKKSDEIKLPDNYGRYLGYRESLDPAADERQLLGCLKRMHEVGDTTRFALFDIITVCMQSVRATRWDPVLQDIILEFVDGKIIPMHLLSDCDRNLCAMFGDLAMRCMTLNPHLLGGAPSQTPGVVLIDEIELHLQPRDQRQVLSQLAAQFPCMQFIVTTASPYVVSFPSQFPVSKLTNNGIERVDYNVPLGLEDTAEIMDLLDGYRDISDGFSIEHNVSGMHEYIEMLSAYCEG
jgi:predicted ATP-binding protein involved in virulence